MSLGQSERPRRDAEGYLLRNDGKPYCNAEGPPEWGRCMRAKGHSGNHENGLSHVYSWPQRPFLIGCPSGEHLDDGRCSCR
jgi:hypothetical protein